jgi:hypothetical protein
LRSYLLLLCLVFALPSWAVADPLTALLACRALTDSAARLACFDHETAALTAAPAAAVAAAPTAPAPAAPESNSASAPAALVSTPAPRNAAPVLDAQQSFGLSGSAIAAHEEAAGARPQKLAKLEARVVALALSGEGRTVFTLDNTQVWRQIESDGDMLAKLGDSATISRGLLGSYWLQLKNGRGCKVTRVR